jgi:hypothetical protein
MWLGACNRNSTVCTPENNIGTTPLELSELIASTPYANNNLTSVVVEINGKVMEIDQFVNYPICNDTWSGIVYVNCDARVAKTEIYSGENPLFFKGCNLTIQPNSVIYVAAHNDQAFYKGCSCHNGENH